MLIEGAFYKLPEILAASDDPQGIYEANIANLFAMGILLEFNARNVENALQNIQLEKRYEKSRNLRADVYVNLAKFSKNLYIYGIRPNNWIEAKYFGGLKRNKGNETKSENAGAIMYDIFRLCCLVPLSLQKKDNMTRYVLNVFNNRPEKYLAYRRESRTERIWLSNLLHPGSNEIIFSLSQEPKTIKELFGKYFLNNPTTELTIKANVETLEFKPFIDADIQFWGYLSRIVNFTIALEGIKVTYDPLQKFDQINIDNLSAIRSELFTVDK
ncbi:MAG: hypothetical protein ABFC84_11895 [Veillonellales bacterium]